MSSIFKKRIIHRYDLDPDFFIEKHMLCFSYFYRQNKRFSL